MDLDTLIISICTTVDDDLKITRQRLHIPRRACPVWSFIETKGMTKRMPGLEKTWDKDYADLQAVVQHCSADLDDEIQVGNYRKQFQYGSRY